MHPVTHLLTSWVVASVPDLEPRDRALITVAGVVPDIDGLGFVAEVLTKNSSTPLFWWSEYHHVFCHNIGFGLLLLAAALVVALRRFASGMLVLVVFHLHLLADLIGSRGPEGYQWPVPYLLPFSRDLQLTWDGQWELNDWRNISLTVVLLITTMYLAWRRGYSPLGMLSRRADNAFVSALRTRFGSPGSPP